MARLPGDETIFETFFAPWYDGDDLGYRPLPGTRPDAEPWVTPGTSVVDASPLEEDEQAEVLRALAQTSAEVGDDWPTYLDVAAPVSLDWIDAFDAYWSEARIADLLDRSDPTDRANDVLVIICELGVTLGDAMRCEAPGLDWVPATPYWESFLLDVQSGWRVNVFDWAMKRFTAAGQADGYASKASACLASIAAGWPERPPT